MPEPIDLIIDGRRTRIPAGATVAVAISLNGPVLRRSVSGQPRGALCGMGICFECRVSIDGKPDRRSCQVIAKPGMIVNTNA